MSSSRPTTWLWGILICGLVWLLFTTHLDGESMGYDEWFTWHYAAEAPLQFTLPANLPAGEYSLWVAVYYWEHQQRLPVSGRDSVRIDSPNNLLEVTLIRIQQSDTHS